MFGRSSPAQAGAAPARRRDHLAGDVDADIAADLARRAPRRNGRSRSRDRARPARARSGPSRGGDPRPPPSPPSGAPGCRAHRARRCLPARRTRRGRRRPPSAGRRHWHRLELRRAGHRRAPFGRFARRPGCCARDRAPPADGGSRSPPPDRVSAPAAPPPLAPPLPARAIPSGAAWLRCWPAAARPRIRVMPGGQPARRRRSNRPHAQARESRPTRRRNERRRFQRSLAPHACL